MTKPRSGETPGFGELVGELPAHLRIAVAFPLENHKWFDWSWLDNAIECHSKEMLATGQGDILSCQLVIIANFP